MHSQTDQIDAPTTDGSAGARKLASRVGSGGDARSGESPDASTHFQCQHLWSAVGADGCMECLWCHAIDRVAVANAPVNEPEEEPCLRCGKSTLDTGWECTECGWDGICVYGPKKHTAV
jgi:hypothetical protein